jgi:hypothetical protein
VLEKASENNTVTILAISNVKNIDTIEKLLIGNVELNL